MAPSPSCKALSAAMSKQGLSYNDVAKRIGKDEQHVIDVCTGKVTPTESEFNALAQALGVQNVPHTGVHSTV